MSEETPHMPRLTRWMLLVGLATVGAGQSVIFAVLPPLGRQIGMADYQIALIFTLAALAFMLSAPYWGRKSDQWGRRRIILLGFLGYAISTALFGVFGDLGRAGILGAFATFVLMTLARLCYALFSSGVFPATQAAIAEAAGPEKRSAAMASIQAAYGIGMIGGPGIAALLVTLAITLPLYAAAAICAIAALVVSRVMPAGGHVARPPQGHLRPTDARLVFLLGIGLLYFIALSGLQQIAAFRYQDLFQLSSAQAASRTGIGFLFCALATLLTQLLIVTRIRLTPATQIALGCALGAAAFLPMATNVSIWQMHALFALTGMSIGFLAPGFNSAVTLAVSPAELGSASGLAVSTQAGGYVIGPLLASLLYQTRPSLPFVISGVVLTGLLLAVLSRRHRLPSPPTATDDNAESR
ncbi:MFS transporter [Lysobacter pythonis]|uniref:MFS transporter n=1 Tax=Solilutibacter pythonis TaxID=2483112 RepID=A0A3M2I0A8_9GAMM|nr:MFS transporter [Lysobacter pythonis]RMH93593.1 MFS transporter [Lysobacter pythonis]